MFEIKGKVNSAVCYAKVVEDRAIEQIRRMCDYELTRDSRIRIMPDDTETLPFLSGRASTTPSLPISVINTVSPILSGRGRV